MTTLAIIPARGGSRGIPRKNLAMCGGKPLLLWTIEAAKGALLVDETVVSSEDREIVDFAAASGVNVDIRSERLARDDSTTEEVIDELLMRPPWSTYRTVALLQPTSPIRTANHIDEAIELRRRENAQSVMSVVPSHSFLWSKNGRRLYPKSWATRQNLPDYYEENGSIYVFTADLWRMHKKLRGSPSLLYVMEEKQRVQVDTPFDLWLAETILRQ